MLLHFSYIAISLVKCVCVCACCVCVYVCDFYVLYFLRTVRICNSLSLSLSLSRSLSLSLSLYLSLSFSLSLSLTDPSTDSTHGIQLEPITAARLTIGSDVMIHQLPYFYQCYYYYSIPSVLQCVLCVCVCSYYFHLVTPHTHTYTAHTHNSKTPN